ncbi:hypothetical protein YQE_07576, partial [Dendroctonus ponderosae]|uniref:Cytoplasmic tRNA 2-thiolation protein 2 n=1 Tax=Dendroctonus ponderosae TaxID=77166 RepID=J3JV37_DENPD
MCSVGEGFEDEEGSRMEKAASANWKGGKCNKCRENDPVILLRKKDAYCKACFLAGANHKFKALLGKSKLIHPKDRVLIACETGHPTMSLLHLLRSGLDLNTQKKLRFEPVLVYVEDNYHMSIGERQRIIRSINNETSRLKFPLHLVSFADSINRKNVLISQKSLALNRCDQGKVNAMFDQSINKTNRRQLLHIMKRNILLTVAKQLNCKYIFTPELSMDIASSLLTNIALGRGSQVPDDTGFCDGRDSEVKILRPLRNFDMKELAMYNVFHKLEPVSVNPAQIDQYSSVQDLMSYFIIDLQENYPATITTVVKTGDKLALNQSMIAVQCKLCQSAILRNSKGLSSAESTRFSKLTSNELPDHNVSGPERYLKLTEKSDHSPQERQQYCFSCSKLSRHLLEEI